MLTAKNFSLLYYGIGTSILRARFALLYDAVSTLYYPQLSKQMAMKIAGEYSSQISLRPELPSAAA